MEKLNSLTNMDAQADYTSYYFQSLIGYEARNLQYEIDFLGDDYVMVTPIGQDSFKWEILDDLTYEPIAVSFKFIEGMVADIQDPCNVTFHNESKDVDMGFFNWKFSLDSRN